MTTLKPLKLTQRWQSLTRSLSIPEDHLPSEFRKCKEWLHMIFSALPWFLLSHQPGYLCQSIPRKHHALMVSITALVPLQSIGTLKRRIPHLSGSQNIDVLLTYGAAENQNMIHQIHGNSRVNPPLTTQASQHMFMGIVASHAYDMRENHSNLSINIHR